MTASGLTDQRGGVGGGGKMSTRRPARGPALHSVADFISAGPEIEGAGLWMAKPGEVSH